MNNTIIELREKSNNSTPNSKSVNTATGATQEINGDYNTILNDPVIVNKGDVIRLKSCFIDSQTEQDEKIELIADDPLHDGQPVGTTYFKLAWGYYITDWGQTTADTTAKYTYSNDATLHPDGLPYVLMAYGITGQNKEISEFKIQVDFSLGGIVQCWIKIYELHNTVATPKIGYYSIKLPMNEPAVRALCTNKENPHEFVVNVANIEKVRAVIDANPNKYDEFTLSLPKLVCPVANLPVGITTPVSMVRGEGNYDNIGIMKGTGVSGEVFEDTPGHAQSLTFHQNFNEFYLPSGMYHPKELAKLITDEMTSTTLTGAGLPADALVPANNRLLVSNKEIRALFKAESGNVVDEAPHFIRIDGAVDLQLTSDLNYIIGSSQFGLIYNEDLSKMELTQIHNSVLDDDGNAVVQGNKPTAGVRNFTNKSTGIFLIDAVPNYLWYGKNSRFKFNPNIITKQVRIPITALANTSGNMPQNLTDSMNITGDENGLDSLIIKHPSGTSVAGDYQAFDVLYDLALQPQMKVASAMTNSIYADSSIGGIDDDNQGEGYFKIAVDCGIRNDVRGSLTQSLSAIVSRYNSQGSFISAYDEGSINYNHLSDEPLYISHFTTRILDPDGTLSSAVGDTNAVYLEIDRAVPEK